MRDQGILGNGQCPHCSAIFVPVPSRVHVACFVCQTAQADGDDCERWQGIPAEHTVARSEHYATIERQAA